MKAHRNLNKLIALTGALILSGLPLARADENKVQLMFVQTAEDLKTDSNTLRLVNVGQQTLYFSDRPQLSQADIKLLEQEGQRNNKASE